MIVVGFVPPDCVFHPFYVILPTIPLISRDKSDFMDNWSKNCRKIMLSLL